MNPKFAKYLIYYPIQWFRKQKVWEYVDEFEKNQYLHPDDLQRLIDSKLEDLIRFAYQHIPYYQRLLKSLGMDPFETWNSRMLQKLPILDKKTILDNFQTLHLDPGKNRLVHRKTSGSTGLTLHFYRSPKALALNDVVMYRCYKWYGIDIGDKQARFWGVPIDFKSRLTEKIKDLVLNRIRISAFKISPEYCLEQYKKIKKFKPVYFYGYTTAIYGFCQAIKEAGLSLKELNLKAVICTAEKMYDHHRQLFTEMFDCPIVDEYGSTENGIIAFQCNRGNYHLMSDHLYVEFVDDDGRPVPAGENGRIVITDLNSFEMPLIRYDIGDIGSSSEDKCRCGVNLPLMNIVEGRKEDFIRTKDGKLIHAAYLCYTLKDDAVREFKMIQKSMDELEVKIVKSNSFTHNTEEKLKNKMNSELGSGVKIKFDYLKRIPREKSGKLRYFISELHNQKQKEDFS